MRRTAVAIAWLTGALVPLVAATVFLVGCCVLPFHQVAHKLMPICHVAADLLRGDGGTPHDDGSPSVPAREKQEPAKRWVSTSVETFRLTIAPVASPLDLAAAARHRSFITLGAVRCDQDIGLHLLGATFLI